jgi:hypothetical protein
VRPERLQYQLASPAARVQRENLPTLFEPLRKIGVEFGGNLAAAALRLDRAGDGNELFAYSRISSE